MAYERFIASRISSRSEGSFSSLIIKIAIIAVALSMTVMIVTTNVITGFKNEISAKVFKFWGHIHITDSNAGNTFEIIPMIKDADLIDSLINIKHVAYARPKTLIDPDAEPPILHSKGGVRAIQSYTIVPAILSDNEQFEGLLLKGIDPDFDLVQVHDFIKRGRFIEFNDSTSSRDLVISEETSKRLGFNVDDKVIIHFILEGEPIKRSFQISGIYKTGLIEYDRRFALVDAGILREMLGWQADQVGGLEVFIDDLSDLELLNDYIYFEKLPSNLFSESVKNKFFRIFEWLKLQNINERVIIILMILVALINMVTALLIFVLERTQMIGILKALGATNWSIRKIFLLQSFHIISKGVVMGNIFALGLCLIQKLTGVFKLNEADYYLDRVPIEFNLTSIILINAGTIIVVLLFLIIPSMIITNIKPVKAIHYR